MRGFSVVIVPTMDSSRFSLFGFLRNIGAADQVFRDICRVMRNGPGRTQQLVGTRVQSNKRATRSVSIASACMEEGRSWWHVAAFTLYLYKL